MVAMEAGDLNEISDRGAFEGLSAADYRTAAARAQRLHAQATTPRLKQYLVEVIARCERLAGETESTAKKNLAEAEPWTAAEWTPPLRRRSSAEPPASAGDRVTPRDTQIRTANRPDGRHLPCSQHWHADTGIG